MEIKENKCEGMIRLRDLSDDFYRFDCDTITVTGSITGNEYRLGDEVRIRVKEVSVEKRQIDLVMLALQPLQDNEESEERLAYLRRERFSDNPLIFLEQLHQRKDELEMLLSKVDVKKTSGRSR